MAAECVIGVDLGGTKLLAAAIDAQLEVGDRVQVEAPQSQTELIETVASAVEHASEGRSPTAVGVGIPCLIDCRTGIAVMAVNLPIENMPFGALLEERLGLPVFVDNDANVAALAEHRFGAARGSTDAVVLTVGTGIGGGLILNGDVYRGSIGAGAELGHMVVQADGPPCQGNCPNHGCLETLASGTALERKAQDLVAANPGSALGHELLTNGELRGPRITELALAGDELAIKALDTVGTWLGVGVASFLNIFNPDVVVIGGGVIAAGDLLLEPVRREVAARALSPSKEHAEIVPARFGPEAGVVGAAALALSELEAAA